MVAGKVKVAMGFNRSPANSRKQDQCSTPPPPPKQTSTAANSGGKPANSSNQKPVFSRSFGVYFPRASAQVHATRSPPDHHDLLRQVEELKERESLLRTELLELKLLKESVSIIPILEAQISNKDFELERYSKKIEALEAENQRLRRELEELNEKSEERRRDCENRVKEMENEVLEMKKTASFREGDEHALFSASQRLEGLVEVSAKSNLIKSLKKVGSSRSSDPSPNIIERDYMTKSERLSHSRSNSEELPETTLSINLRSRAPRVPKPPPKPSSSSSLPVPASSSGAGNSTLNKPTPATEKPIPPPPPPPANVSKSVPRPPPPPQVPRTDSKPSPGTDTKSMPPPPPPPPPVPAKSLRLAAAKVRRVPEVVEFYHSLMRRDSSSRRDSSGGTEPALASANARDMIGEIENRSAHLLAIKTDVETQGDFIRFLIKEVQNAAFADIEDVVPFVKWLDDELSYLVDERAVLKHFDWPEQKADALREAAFGYSDLKKLESEASSFRDDPRQPCGPALKKMQALLEKLEHGVYNLSRMRESSGKRYKGFRIPVDWMLENGIINQIKLASVKLAMKYMKRVSAELETVGGSPDEEELIVQSVRFAFRVHQFAGGFDVETMKAFQELRDKARSCHVQCQNQNHQKIMCRCTTC